MKLRTIIFWILTLVIADQVIKIVINSFFLETQFAIIPSLFDFKPTFNDKHSYINVLLYQKYQINLGLWFHIILFLIIELIVITMYFYFRNNILKNKKLLDSALIFQIATVICAFIGNLIWKNGTLDYIYLKPLFIFDLKDLYSNCFTVLFLIYAYKNIDEIKMIKTKDITLHVKRYFGKREIK